MSRSMMRGYRQNLLTEETTGTSPAFAVPPSLKNHTIYIIGSHGVSAGAVTVEVATNPDAPDTEWAPLGGSPITVQEDECVVYAFEGVYGAVRVNITTDVEGGTVTVDYVAA